MESGVFCFIATLAVNRISDQSSHNNYSTTSTVPAEKSPKLRQKVFASSFDSGERLSDPGGTPYLGFWLAGFFES